MPARDAIANRKLAAAAALLALLAPGCARRKRARVPPPPAPPAFTVGWSETGIASWYGHPYHGRAASSGEIYDMEKLTAAHRILPFNARVRVSNLANHRRVEVRINDRGPFIEGRIVDLSRAAARALGMLGPGTARVRLDLIALPPRLPAGYYAVQTGAFRNKDNAERLQQLLGRDYGFAQLQFREGHPSVWRVLVGREATLEAAASLAQRLKSRLGAAFVVRVDTPSGPL